MFKTYEAMIDENGNVYLLQPLSLPKGQRALVTVMDEKSVLDSTEVSLLSEAALAQDWTKPEEDKAWFYLQSER